MLRAVLHYTLSAFAALGFVSLFASGAIAGEHKMRTQHMNDELVSGVKGDATNKPKTLEEATQKGQGGGYVPPGGYKN